MEPPFDGSQPLTLDEALAAINAHCDAQIAKWDRMQYIVCIAATVTFAIVAFIVVLGVL